MSEFPHPSGSPDAILTAAGAPTVAAAMLVVGDAIRLGQLDLALGLLDSLRRRYGEEPAIELTRVALMARTGRLHEAEQLAATVSHDSPSFFVPRLYEAQLLAQRGNRDDALRLFRQLVAKCPDYPGLAGSLATLLLPGPGYREVLAVLHRNVAPRGYLEIGVETGATLALADCPCIVGIDPDFRPLQRSQLRPHSKLFEMTSAAFFSKYQRSDILSVSPLDLVFIDGLHRFEASVADFAAVERWSHDGTVVVMHDALPIAPEYATGARSTRFWVGDVWKTVLVLLKARPDLRVRIIATPPSGLVVITQLKPNLRLPEDFYRAAVAEADKAVLTDELLPWPTAFPVVSNDDVGYREALGPLDRDR